MNKVVIAIGVIVVVIGAAAYYFTTNLNSIAEGVIERSGSDAVGSQVSVGGVEISLREGRAVIDDFSIANPEGFSDEDMLRFDQLTVGLDLRSLTGEVPRITSITTVNPFLRYEMSGGTSNLDVVRERLAAGAPPEEDPEAPAQRLAIDDLQIEGIRGMVVDPRLPQPVNISLGDIQLQDMEGTPEEIARQIARPLIAQLSRNAAQAVLSATGSLLQEDLSARADEAVTQLREQAQEQLGGVGEQVNQALDQAVGEELRRGLGDLFGGGREEEEADAPQ